MRTKKKVFLAISAMTLVCFSTGFSNRSESGHGETVHRIVASDTILSGMIAALLPSDRYAIDAVLPPGQCPGHYDVKISDIEKMNKADLTVSFSGMPFMNKGGGDGRERLIVTAGGRNWMAPDSYISGLDILAESLSKRFPEDKDEIMRRKDDVIHEVKAVSHSLIEEINRSEFHGKPIIVASMQKEVLEWMGFEVLGEYGRQEAMTAREVVRLTEIGRGRHAIMVVDNLQSGPDAGKAIAETLGVPHIVLTNFPSESGYLTTLKENVAVVLATLKRK
ncbi:MAG: zinc ABC transporter substrate-binding protein [Pseudomonadota bacterium]